MDFNTVVMSRYATKHFDGKAIAQEQVDKLLEMIRYAPSSFNLQPWKVKVVTDQATKDKLVAASWNQPQVNTCSHLLVLCANTLVDELIDKLEEQMLATGTPKEKLAGYFEIMRGFAKNVAGDARLTWAQKQVYIALANALNGAKALGFDSCPMEGFDPKQYSEILNLPEHIVPTVVCPIGYAADEPRPKLRFPTEDIVL